MTLNSKSSCLCWGYRYVRYCFTPCWGWKAGLCACLISTLPPELHPCPTEHMFSNSQIVKMSKYASGFDSNGSTLVVLVIGQVKLVMSMVMLRHGVFSSGLVWLTPSFSVPVSVIQEFESFHRPNTFFLEFSEVLFLASSEDMNNMLYGHGCCWLQCQLLLVTGMGKSTGMCLHLSEHRLLCWAFDRGIVGWLKWPWGTVALC